MIKKWQKFNEDIFDKSEEENTFKDEPKVKNVLTDSRLDTLVLQEISDRLYGPDSEEYVKAIEELNKKFRPRRGRSASDLYDPNLDAKRKAREQEIINRFK